jgi:hypothetical protein
MPNDEGGVSLAGALALAESPGTPLSPAGWALEERHAVALDLRCHGALGEESACIREPARASLDAIVLVAGFEDLSPSPAPSAPSKPVRCRARRAPRRSTIHGCRLTSCSTPP